MILTAYLAASLTAYLSLSKYFEERFVLGRLGIGLVSLGLFFCLFTIFMLRLPTIHRQTVGQHWLDFFPSWAFGSFFVLGGCYCILYAIF